MFLSRFKSFIPPVVPSWTSIRCHTGYIPFEGRFARVDNPLNRHVTQRSELTLEPVKKLHFQFDPFHPNIGGIRGAMHAFSTDKVRATNHKCIVKFDVLSDGSEPTLRVELNNASQKPIVFKAGHLTDSEIMFNYNKLILPLATPEEVIVKFKKRKKRRMAKVVSNKWGKK